jgi:hypothetical protein
MLVYILQLASTLWTITQLGYFRLIDPIRRRLLSPSKPPLPNFAPRPLRVCHQLPPCKWRRLTFPRPLQLFHFCLQTLQQLLQSQVIDAQPLIVGSLSHQFQLQFCDPLVFRAGLGILLPLVTHPAKFTAFSFLPSESFDLCFSEV